MKKFGLLMIVLFALAAAAYGQQRPAPDPTAGPEDDEAYADPGSARGGQASPEKREEVRKKMEAVRIMRLTEALRLDEKTAAKFIPVITALEQRRRELMRDNQENARALREALAFQKPDEKKLKALLEQAARNHQEMMKLREKELDASKENLTTEQQARYVLFQHDFMREMRGMIRALRGGPGGMGRGPGMRGRSGE
jgi:Spy/CpxP family protein refolding chaperone